VLSTSDEVQTWGSAGYEWMRPEMEIIAKYPMRGAIAQPTLSFRPVTHIVVTADQGKDPVANPSHAILITRVTIDLVTLKTKLTNLVDNNPMDCHIVLAGHDGTIYLSTSKAASDIPFTTKPAEVINNQGDTAAPTGDYAKRRANDIFPWLENMIWDDNDRDTPPPASYQQYEFEDYIVKAQQLPEPLSNFVVIMAMTDNTQSIDVGFRTMSDIVILMAVLPILIIFVQFVLMGITLYKVMNMEMSQEERIKLGVANAQRFAKRGTKLIRGSIVNFSQKSRISSLF